MSAVLDHVLIVADRKIHWGHDFRPDCGGGKLLHFGHKDFRDLAKDVAAAAG